MKLNYFKCEECGYEIKRIEKFWDISEIKTGKKILKCSECASEYRTHLISRMFFGICYNVFGGLVIISILFLLVVLENYIWLSLFIVMYIFLEVASAFFIPLKKIEQKIEIKNNE